MAVRIPKAFIAPAPGAARHTSVGLAGIFVAILVFAVIYERSIRVDGARQALEIALSEPVEWTLAGVVTAIVYQPPRRWSQIAVPPI